MKDVSKFHLSLFVVTSLLMIWILHSYLTTRGEDFFLYKMMNIRRFHVGASLFALNVLSQAFLIRHLTPNLALRRVYLSLIVLAGALASGAYFMIERMTLTYWLVLSAITLIALMTIFRRGYSIGLPAVSVVVVVAVLELAAPRGHLQVGAHHHQARRRRRTSCGCL